MACEVNPAVRPGSTVVPEATLIDLSEAVEQDPAARRGSLTVTSATASPTGDVELEDGKVEEMRKVMLLYGDHGMAQRLQDREYASKYAWNRHERRTARTDVPLAIQTQTEEDRELELRELERLERQKKTIDEDERIARELESQERARSNPGEGGGLAQGSVEDAADDAELARRLQTEDLLSIEREKIRRELIDEDFARRMQLAIEAEERDDAPDPVVMMRLGREVAYHSLDDSASPLGDSGDESLGAAGAGGQGLGVGRRLGGSTFIVGRFRGFELPPSGALNDMMTERERKELIHLQDEELAKALQEQENMRHLHMTSARDTESRDAQLAYVMQQLEQLRAEQRAAGTAAGGIREHMMIQPPAYGNIYSPAPCHPPGKGSPPAYQQHPHPQPPAPSQEFTIFPESTTAAVTAGSMPNRSVGPAPTVRVSGSTPNQSVSSVATVPTDLSTSTLTTTVRLTTVGLPFNSPSHHENENFVNEIGEHFRRQNSQPSSMPVQGEFSPAFQGQSRPLPTPPLSDEPSASSQSQPNTPVHRDDVFMSQDGSRGQAEGQRVPSRSLSVGAAGTSDSTSGEDSKRRRSKLGGKRKTSCKTQ